MITANEDDRRFRYGDAVKVRAGFLRKPWEWIGSVQMISGNKVAVTWRMILPGNSGARPITYRTRDELELVKTAA